MIALFRQVEDAAHQRLRGEIFCADIMSRAGHPALSLMPNPRSWPAKRAQRERLRAILARMRGGGWNAIVFLCVACGGRAAQVEPSAGAGSTAQFEVGGGGAANAPSVAAGASFGGANASGAAGLEGGVGGALMPPRPDYVPDQAVPFDHAYFEDGSFEDFNGFGWDTCRTHTPGRLTQTQGQARDGVRSFEFSSEACDTCLSGGPSASQIYLWFTQQPAAAMSLYFDVLNVSSSPPLGELRLEVTNGLCIAVRPLANIELADLALQRTWQTRCVDIPSFGADRALGVAVVGTSFDVALDAFRLGPPCHAR